MGVLIYLEPGDGIVAARQGGPWFAPYVREVLAHAGLPVAVADRQGLPDALTRHRLLLLPYDAPLNAAARNAVADFARQGAVLGIGGTSGLDALFGVQASGTLPEGYGAVAASDDLSRGVTSSLHCWDIRAVRADAGTRTTLRVEAAEGSGAAYPLACRRERALLITADLPGTIVRIQQGLPITHDGMPAPDGSAAIDDGILKTDDGMALDWRRDRREVEGHPCFLEPVADDWRDLLLRGIFALCREIGLGVPLLWYWPEDLPAVALLSHDSDGNVEALAWQELAAVERAGIRSSWCFIRSPETYPRRFFETVAEHGHEVCLHYDAHSAAYPGATFSEASFREQLRWLRELLPAVPISSNKNHYLRWEGWTEPWRWMEAAGIDVDQGKGPSKRGNCGFLFGGSHPWFPIEDAAHGSRLLDVLEINLFAQDLIVAAPPELAGPLIRRARRRGGVAHFLFHPAHVAKPGVVEAMARTIAAAREQGMPWWTGAAIGRWERARRRVRLAVRGDALHAEADMPIAGGTLLLLDVGQPHPGLGWEQVERWGFPFWRIVADLPAVLPLKA